MEISIILILLKAGLRVSKKFLETSCEERRQEQQLQLSRQLLWNSQFSETAGPVSIPSLGGTSMRPSDGDVRPSDGTLFIHDIE